MVDFADSADERRGKLVGSASGAQQGASEMMYLTEGPGGHPMPWTTTTAEPAQPAEPVEQVVVVVVVLHVCSEIAEITVVVVVAEGENPAVD